jgi:hypothetical protein
MLHIPLDHAVDPTKLVVSVIESARFQSFCIKLLGRLSPVLAGRVHA